MQEYALVLRSCRHDMTSRTGFRWPDVGGVAVAPDWDANYACGKGLHGWLYGVGDALASYYLGGKSKWLVLKVKKQDIVDLRHKVKFPEAEVLFVGDRHDAASYILANEPKAKGQPVIGASVSAGDYGTATVGDFGAATAGYNGIATAGHYGTATVGYNGTATAGYYGTATAGYNGTATAGNSGTILIKFFDTVTKRLKIKTGYIGEDGLLPNVAYKLDEKNNFIVVKE